MNIFKKVILLSIFSFPILAHAFVSYDIGGRSFEVYGRVKTNNMSQPYLSWPGSSIKARFRSSAVSLVLDDDEGKNYYSVILDGDVANTLVLATKKGTHSYPIADNLADTEHVIEIYKRTEGWEGGTWFLELVLGEKGRLLPPPSRPKRKIAFFGDSITSGMGNEAVIGAPDNVAAEKNNYWSYSAISARALNAEHQTVSLSGIGIMISWFEFVMPDYFDQISAVGNNQSQWDFKRWQPEVVVINLMQNDSWLVDREKRLKPAPSSDDIVSAYRSFIDSILAVYPDAHYICALGSMDATKPGSPWPGYVEKAVQQIRSNNKKIKMDTLFFDYTGFDAHPRVAHHKKNAAKLTQFIRQKLKW